MALNDFVAENDSCQTVNMFKRVNDPVALNAYALLKEVTTEVVDSSIGMFVPVLFGNFNLAQSRLLSKTVVA